MGRTTQTERPAASPRSGGSSTLMRLGALAALGAVIALVISPLTTVLAPVSPPAYAVVASFTMATPMLAALMVPRFGSATFVAFFTAALLIATPLGPLLIVALTVPALAIELVLFSARRRSPRPPHFNGGALPPVAVWMTACAAGGLTIGVLSLAVLSPEVSSPALIALILALRVGAYVGIGALVRRLRAQLHKAGL